MTPIEKCIQTLHSLIERADPLQIPLAELAIREMVDSEEADTAKANALSILANTLAPVQGVAESPPVTRFTADLLDHIEKLQRSFGKIS
jgi:hypothetical protein